MVPPAGTIRGRWVRLNRGREPAPSGPEVNAVVGRVGGADRAGAGEIESGEVSRRPGALPVGNVVVGRVPGAYGRLGRAEVVAVHPVERVGSPFGVVERYLEDPVGDRVADDGRTVAGHPAHHPGHAA